MKGNEKEKRKWPGKSTEVSRKYEVIGTVLDRKVFSSSFEVQVLSSLRFSAFRNKLIGRFFHNCMNFYTRVFITHRDLKLLITLYIWI